ncbi:acetyl-CoA carboxylase biotin carboxyl carrier protein [Lactiplantibacillus daowaiensis]|uniref:Acetyl-CoA carboxylase biotin carboxyl carrier protein n=1 Tax=Lactiplantibacillus daowaiensis TaxID=2559918 RepID=A0ABW1RXN2_9LACO|nr:biotin/lipoyl-containing protein [Lactiplantibacillus daowaiensis]
MDLKDLDRLVAKYAQAGYQHIRVKAGDLEIEVSHADATKADAPVAVTNASATVDETVMTSPMVGVVHLAPELVVGQAVQQGQELGQIESMKLFNPLLAPHAGVVAAILVADQAAVEYQQPLFKLRKDR